MVVRFKELTSPHTDFIGDKEFLARQYISAIFDHLKSNNNGYVIQRKSTGVNDYAVMAKDPKDGGKMKEINIATMPDTKPDKNYKLAFTALLKATMSPANEADIQRKRKEVLPDSTDGHFSGGPQTYYFEFAMLQSIVKANNLRPTVDTPKVGERKIIQTLLETLGIFDANTVSTQPLESLLIDRENVM
jgi:hypothetical protein